jgi:hypothetical protein
MAWEARSGLKRAGIRFTKQTYLMVGMAWEARSGLKQNK